MDEKRMGEIALAILRDRVRREPIRLGQEAKRELGNLGDRVNMAKAVNISIEELKLFARTLIQEAVEETFGS